MAPTVNKRPAHGAALVIGETIRHQQPDA